MLCRPAWSPFNNSRRLPGEAARSSSFAAASSSGINTRLTLYAKSRLDTGGGTFSVSEEYLGTRDGNRRFDTRGRWIILRGTPTDVDATVYQLNFDEAERVMFFQRVGDEAVRLLDRDQREIRSTANYTLTRMTEIVPGGYTSIDPAAPEAKAAAEYAVSEQSSRTGMAVALRRLARAERQIVAGLNYRLCLEVTVADKPEEARAIVYRNLQQRFSLTEWSTGACTTP
jgi:hypothetical protein